MESGKGRQQLYVPIPNSVSEHFMYCAPTCSSSDSRSGPSSPAHTARRMSSGPRRKLENWVSMMLMLFARDSGMSDTAPSGFLGVAAAMIR
jgi:hypothetical protein